MLDDAERTIEDGVNAVKSLTRDPRLVPGAGATEIELARQIVAYGERTPGLNQHAIKKYGEALQVIPRTLAETCGLDATDVVSKLHAQHAAKEKADTGVDVENATDGTMSTIDAPVATTASIMPNFTMSRYTCMQPPAEVDPAMTRKIEQSLSASIWL